MRKYLRTWVTRHKVVSVFGGATAATPIFPSYSSTFVLECAGTLCKIFRPYCRSVFCLFLMHKTTQKAAQNTLLFFLET